MRQFDLRKKNEVLDPLAPFKVLSLMCHPRDLQARERMMGLILQGIGEKPRRSPESGDEFISSVQRGAHKGLVAGSILLTRLQLQLLGYPHFTLSAATPLTRAHLSFERPRNFEKRNWDASTREAPVSASGMRAAYELFLPVAHLWAAWLHGLQHNRSDIFPGSNECLPTFLAFANCILRLACALPAPNRKQRFALTSREAWTIILPEHLRLEKELRPLALPPILERALSTPHPDSF